MEKLLKYYPRNYLSNGFGIFNLLLILSVVIVLMMSCQIKKQDYYKKEFNEEERLALAEKLLNGLGYRYYYQGSVGEQLLLEEAKMYNPKHAEVWREEGIPYLKRGIASGYLPNYEKCVFYDSLGWQGYRGYCTLYFYRDYERALKDFDELDVLTPNFTDYPQATSIDYMRGLCYLGLEQPQKALEYLTRHLETESKAVGYKYIPSVDFIAKAQAHLQLGEIDKAQTIFELGIEHCEQNADLEFYLAQLLFEKGEIQKALHWVEKAKQSFNGSFSNIRPYVEEFFHVYLADIEDLEKQIREM